MLEAKGVAQTSADPWRRYNSHQRLRLVAWSYRQALSAVSAAARRDVDEFMVHVGQGWIVGYAGPAVEDLSDEDWLTEGQAASLIGCHPVTLARHRRSGRLPAAPIEGTRSFKYQVKDLRAFLRSSRHGRKPREHVMLNANGTSAPAAGDVST